MRGSLKKVGKYYYAIVDIGKSNELDKNGRPKRIQKKINTKCEKKADAEKVLNGIINEINNKTYVVPVKRTFIEYIIEYITRQKDNKKIEISTYEYYNNTIEKHFKPFFKELYLHDIQPINLQEYYDYKLQKCNLSPNTVLKHHAIIHGCLRTAQKMNIIKINHADNIDLPSKTKYIIKKVYDENEINVLLNIVEDTIIETPVYLAALLGLRRSELLGLKWENVNLDKKEIHIKKVRVRFMSIIEKDRTKNIYSTRKLAIPDILVNYLTKVKEKQEINKQLCGNCYNDGGYVCCSIDGNPINPDTLDRKFKKILSSNNLPHIRIHDLRHSNASILYKLGASLKDIQEWLGHGDYVTTANIYTHIFEENKKQNANKIDEIFKNMNQNAVVTNS